MSSLHAAGKCERAYRDCYHVTNSPNCCANDRLGNRSRDNFSKLLRQWEAEQQITCQLLQTAAPMRGWATDHVTTTSNGYTNETLCFGDHQWKATELENVFSRLFSNCWQIASVDYENSPSDQHKWHAAFKWYCLLISTTNCCFCYYILTSLDSFV